MLVVGPGRWHVYWPWTFWRRGGRAAPATTPEAKREKMRLRSANMFSTALSTLPSGPRSARLDPHTDTQVVEATHCRLAASDTTVDTKKQN